MKRIPTYIGVCCREWVLAYAGRGRCGLCGSVPVFVRDDAPSKQDPDLVDD